MSQIIEHSDATAQMPPLVSGDHLDQPTFHERYERMPENFKAELVEGVVIVQAAASLHHGDVHSIVMTWLGVYRAATPGTSTFDNATAILGPRSEPQPDAALVVDPDYGGQTHVEGNYLAGPPELIVEVAFSSAAYDLHSKLRDYERAGVREYLVVVLHEKRVEWFALVDGKFQPHAAEADGNFQSSIFPGLWLDPAALMDRDIAKVLAVLQNGLETTAHADFAAQLQQRETGSGE